METNLIFLADAYSNHWIHRVLRPGEICILLEVESEALPQAITSPFYTAFAAEISTGWQEAQWPPQGDEVAAGSPVDVYGFEAILWETSGMGVLRETAESVWERAYPMNDTPTPAQQRNMGSEG
jgi:hypothetical protein